MKELIFEGHPTICETFAVSNIEFLSDKHDFSPEPDIKHIILFPDERMDYLEGYKVGFYKYNRDSEHLILHPKILLGFLEQLKIFANKYLIEFGDTNEANIEMPFTELTNFITPSNRFGTFGQMASKKLANEFVFYKQDFLSYLENLIPDSAEHEFVTTYYQLLEIFNHASNNGLVIFT
jgi:hypothetical protein